MAIVPTYITDQQSYRSAVTLEHYAKVIGYSECAIYGVDNPDDRTRTEIGDQCRDIWSLDQRNYALRYFDEAQEELENEMKRLLSPTWVTGNLSDTGNARLTDIQVCMPAYYTKWNNLISMGRQVIYEVEEGSTVDHTGDPAIIGPVTIDGSIVTDLNYVKVLYPDTELEINPSKVYLDGLDLYIEVPRCRMVRYDLRDNSDAGVDYTDTSLFQQTVDVYYYATEDTNSVVDFGNGNIGLWYLAGETVPTVQQLDMIMRLAHSKMPDTPCGCSAAVEVWERDRNIPDFLTPDRLECPFGINDGSWITWKWAQTMKHLRLGYNA